jgi:hypothetical protein
MSYWVTREPKNWMDWRWMKKLPPTPAVYVMFVEGVVKPYYIGATEDLRNRFHHGHYKFIKERRVVKVKWKLTRRWGDWLMIEKRLVDRLKPVANRGGDPEQRYSRRGSSLIIREEKKNELTAEEQVRLDRYIVAKKEGRLKEYFAEVKKEIRLRKMAG